MIADGALQRIQLCPVSSSRLAGPRRPGQLRRRRIDRRSDQPVVVPKLIGHARRHRPVLLRVGKLYPRHAAVVVVGERSSRPAEPARTHPRRAVDVSIASGTEHAVQGPTDQGEPAVRSPTPEKVSQPTTVLAITSGTVGTAPIVEQVFDYQQPLAQLSIARHHPATAFASMSSTGVLATLISRSSSP